MRIHRQFRMSLLILAAVCILAMAVLGGCSSSGSTPAGEAATTADAVGESTAVESTSAQSAVAETTTGIPAGETAAASTEAAGASAADASVDDEAAYRSRPRAGGSVSIDQNILAVGRGAWQGDRFITAAKTAFGFINQRRTEAGVGELHWDDDLAACAMVRSMELPSAFSHTRPDGSDWYTVCPDLMYGENLAQGYSSPDEAVAAWMNSPEHKNNILTPGFTCGGIGIYEVAGRWYWTQEFGYR